MSPKGFKQNSVEEENESLREQLSKIQNERDAERSRRMKLETLVHNLLACRNDEQRKFEQQLQQALGSADELFPDANSSMEADKAATRPPEVESLEGTTNNDLAAASSGELAEETVIADRGHSHSPKKPRSKTKVKNSDSPQRQQPFVSTVVPSSSRDAKEAKIKAKKDAPLAPTPQVTCAQLLASMAPIKISPRPLSLSIARIPLGKAYGLPFVQLAFEGYGRNGDRNILFPGHDSNPDLPKGPGLPGLLLGDRTELTHAIWSLIIQLKGQPIRYSYYGEYKLTVYGDLPANEFAALNDKVKLAWGRRLSKVIDHDAHRRLRASLTLRQLGNGDPPEEDQIVAEMEKICSLGRKYVSPKAEYVVAALERGEEHIKVHRLECVSYSHKLAREYQRASDTQLEPPDSDFGSDDYQKDDSPALSKSTKRKRTSAPSTSSQKQKKRKITTTALSKGSKSTPKSKTKGKGKQREPPVELDESESESSEDPDFRVSSSGSPTPMIESSTRRSQRERKASQKVRMQY